MMSSIVSSETSDIKKDTLKVDKPQNKGQTLVLYTNPLKEDKPKYTLYKITSKRGQPLYKGQNSSSEECRDSTVASY